MEVRAMSGKRGIATYELCEKGSVYLISVVKQGNCVESYSKKYFENEYKLSIWLNSN